MVTTDTIGIRGTLNYATKVVGGKFRRHSRNAVDHCSSISTSVAGFLVEPVLITSWMVCGDQGLGSSMILKKYFF